MKRTKSIWIYILVVMLSVAMMIGSTNLVALAEMVPGGKTLGAEGGELFSGNIVNKVKLGEEFSVPEADYVSVSAPNGKEAEISGTNTVVAEQLGNYIVTYTGTIEEGKEVNYSYNVYCYEETEYFLYVTDGGASIPTYASVGKEIAIPEFYLAYKDDDGKTVKAANYTTMVDNTSGTYNRENNTITASTQGTLFITLKACIGPFANATKIYSTEFKVNVQTDFEDKIAPVLTVTNVPTTGNINSVVNVPIATATDNYDSNISFKVEVKDPSNNAVKDVVVNDHGYATESKEEELKFDNKEVTSFYPTTSGTYIITYNAIDDSGNESGVQTYYVEVNDNLAPGMDFADEAAIPTVWGLSVENAEEELDDTSFVIPMPNVYDNASVVDNIRLVVEIKSAGDDAKTVARYEGTIAEFKAGINVADSYKTYFNDGVDLQFTENGLEFDFNNIKYGSESEQLDEDDMLGDWLITYTVRDEAGQSSSSRSSKKEFTVKLEKAFQDVDAPTVDDLVLPDYIMVGTEDDDDFEVPRIVAKDDKDTALDINYVLSSDAEVTDAEKANGITVVKEVVVNGGEIFEVIKSGDNYYLTATVKNEEIALKLNENLTVNYSATDDAGNKVEGDAQNINVLYASSIDGQALEVECNINTTGKVSKEPVNLGGFTVSNVTHREYTGFEITLKDSNGETLSGGLTLYTYYNKAGDTLYVKDICFGAANGGVYQLYIRVFDITGYSKVYAYAIDIEGKTSGGVVATAAPMASTGDTFTKYDLRHTEIRDIDGADDNYVMVYKISGGRFSLMGHEFTALTQGQYTFVEYYMVDNTAIDADSLTQYDSYSMNAGSTASPVIEVQGVMPSYNPTTSAVSKVGQYKEEEYIVLPAIVAFTEYANAEVTVTVKDPDNTNVKAYKLYEDAEGNMTFEEEGNNVTGQWAFNATKDGTYVVTVNAQVDGSPLSTATYNIAVGDVAAPKFTIMADTASDTAVVGDTFTFRNITDVEDNVDVADSKINITARLIDPSDSEVTSVSRTWSSWQNDKNITKTSYKFAKSGTYTVEYRVTDSKGNESLQKYTITVSGKSSRMPISSTALSTILIIVGVMLIAVVILYFVRFRTVKK